MNIRKERPKVAKGSSRMAWRKSGCILKLGQLDVGSSRT